MKLRQRIISLILILTIVLPITTQLAFAESSEEYAVPTVSYILEAENTSLNPNRSIKDDSIASSNQYLHIKENNSKVSFTVPSDAQTGTYTITVTAKHPYGYKENYLSLNGERIGTIVGDSSQWQDYSFTNQTISANDVIEIELYWGWFDVDSIKLVKTGTASEIINTYRIEADRMELNDSYDIIDSSSASGNKCVRAYQYTDFKFSVPQNFESGRYDITVVARHPYGYKKNYLCVNEKQVGIIEGESYNWTEYIFENQTVNPNDVIELQMDWGWFDVDYIKITPAKTEHTYSFEAEQATLSNDYLLADDKYDFLVYFEDKHKNYPYYSYLFIDKEENVMSKPILYSYDSITAIKYNFIGHSKICDIPMDNSYLAETVFSELLNSLIRSDNE